MARLPKKKTMLDTIARVKGYSMKLYQANKFTVKDLTALTNSLNNLIDAVDKK